MQQFISILLALLAAHPLSGAPDRFQVTGPGGGGAMYNPTISPLDANTVLVSCDMTGGYISHDAGRSWRMFNLRGTVRFFTFDPQDPKTMYAQVTGLWRSRDGGETWNLIYPRPSAIQAIQMEGDEADETIVANQDPPGMIQAMAIDPNDSRTLYTATASGLYVSRNAGDTWTLETRLPEAPLRMSIDPYTPPQSRRMILAGPHGVQVWSGRRLVNNPGPAATSFVSVSIGFSVRAEPVIYGSSGQKAFVSGDAGAHWRECTLPGRGARMRAIATSERHPAIGYLSYDELQMNGKTWMGVAKSADFGRTWQMAWQEDYQAARNVKDAWITPRFGPGWAEAPLTLGVAGQDPDLCYATDLGRTMQTTDGGTTWRAMYSRRAESGSWTSTGLDVTTSYGWHQDPFDGKRQFITYTDIGLFRSEDGGHSWFSSTAGVPRAWQNTTYWVEFDPAVRGRMWSVNSGTHDLPRPKMWRAGGVRYKGGVCRSDDGGKTWAASNSGMDETAPTHILLDPASPPGARVLYVAAFGKGVYKSGDGGRTWALKNRGIAGDQPFAWRIVRDAAGVLYVLIARRSEDGRIGDAQDGAIYRSSDGAENWTRVSLPAGVNAPNGLAVDPGSPKRLYLAAWARAKGMRGEGGGVYLSEDSGQSWRCVLNRDQHVYDVTVDGRDRDRLYATGFESSAWRSTDRGEHWTRIPGFNFKWGQRVIPDPADPESVYITTFGGSVWHGPVNGTPRQDIRTPQMEPGK